MYRVYQCPHCSNIGFAQVSREDDENSCSLCTAPVVDEKGTLYAATVQEAEGFVKELVLQSNASRSQAKPSRGLGVRKRILLIVDALVDTNRGWPVAIEKVMREATEAGIDLSKASRALYSLIDQGLILESDGKIILTERGGVL